MDLYPRQLATFSRPQLESAIRRRVQTAYLGDGVVLARILGRHKILLRGTDRGFACHLMLDGHWEIWVTQFFAKYLRPGMNVVDVGANFGYYTLLFADAVGSTGTVISVEPNPDTVRLLRETVSLNGFAERTRVVNQALAEEKGKAWLYSPDGEPKNALIVEHPDFPGGRTFEVETTSLDELTADSLKIDLVKIDAEGGELAIIAGMAKLIARDRPAIVLEFNAARYAEPREFLEVLLANYGYAHEIVSDGTVSPLDFDTVTNPTIVMDRILVFGFSSLVDPPHETATKAIETAEVAE